MHENELPKTVPKPWGEEIWFARTDAYAGKVLRVEAGGRLSVQYHERKDETSYLLSGRLRLLEGSSADAMVSREIAPGSAWRHEPGSIHSAEAIEDSVIVEVSTPELDDVVRISDLYGRAD